MRNVKTKELLNVTITNVTKGETMKDIYSNGFACVYTNEEGQNCYSFLGGVNTVRVVGIAFGLRRLAEEIEKALKDETSDDLVEQIKEAFKNEYSVTRGEH